jgi:putative membrane protein
MKHNPVHHASELPIELLLALPFVLAVLIYLLLGWASNKHHKRWPIYRYIFWVCGVLFAAAALIGPIADKSHENFTAHMVGHLLLGMLAPLLLAYAAPVTLLLRTLRVDQARKLSRVLKSFPVRIYCHPVVASILNIGGLMVLYTTELYSAMHHYALIHIIVHLHIFLAGYLYTISILYIDPMPHRYSFILRAMVLILSLAAHSILSKYIYAYPPAGVPIEQAQMGGMIMYYGGDIVEVVLIFFFCHQWYKAARPRTTVSISH